MSFKKKIENIGRRIIGEGPEVSFSNEVEEYEKEHGVSTDEAKKELFLFRHKDLLDELMLTGTLQFNSQEYRNFTAGMNEVFSETEIEAFKSDALLPSFSVPSRTIGRTNFEKTQKQFKDKYEGNVPNNTILRDTAENIKELEGLLSRLPPQATLASFSDMNDLLSAYPDIGADFGRMMYLQEEIERVNKEFGKEFVFEKDMAELKERTKAVFSKSTTKEVSTFFKSILTGTKHISSGNFAKAMTHSTSAFARISIKGVLGAAKLGYSASKAGASLVNKSIKK